MGMTADDRKPGPTVRHLRRWGAVYVLVILFLGSLAGQFFAEMSEFAGQQHQHGEEFVWSPFLVSFSASVLENWQSEWFQLVFQAILLLGAKHLIFQADAEDLERIERKLDEVQYAVGARSSPPTEAEEEGDASAVNPEPTS